MRCDDDWQSEDSDGHCGGDEGEGGARLTTLRMVKSALKNKEIDKREALTDAEERRF